MNCYSQFVIFLPAYAVTDSDLSSLGSWKGHRDASIDVLSKTSRNVGADVDVVVEDVLVLETLGSSVLELLEPFGVLHKLVDDPRSECLFPLNVKLSQNRVII